MAIGFGGQSQQRWGDNTLNANEFMRDLMLTDYKGVSQSTAAARKKGMVLLAFFDPSEPTSRRALAALQRLADGYKETGKLSVFAVSQADIETTRAFADQNGVTFPLLPDFDHYYTMTYGIGVVPAVFLADGAGMVLVKARGFVPEAFEQISAHVANFAEVEPVRVAAAEAAAAV